MLRTLVFYFFPDIQKEEFKKFSILAGTFSLVIGTYWLLRLLKNTIFIKIAFPEELGWVAHQGRLFQPLAKFWSPFVVLAVVLIYSKLVDLFKKHQLFYIICSFYGFIFFNLSMVLLVKDLFGSAYIGKWALALAGWVSYFAIESFGSLLPALFWSFTISITETDSAKRGFPLIVAFAQIGAVAGSSVMLFSEHIGSLWPILFTASIFVCAIMGMIYYFMKSIPAHEMVGNKEAAKTEKQKEGFFEGFISGLVLLFSRPYLLGVLIVSTFYEVIAQVMDYQMQSQAAISPEYASDVAFGKFQGIMGVCTNSLAFLVALLGTSYLIKKLGIRLSLLMYPVLVAITLVTLFTYYQIVMPTGTHLLWALFLAYIIVKAISYAVNNPIKDMMYIPTSKDAKFKSKGWIDMFGGRFAKAGGAQITNRFKETLHELMVFGTYCSLGLIGIWMLAAIYVGYKNQQLVKDGEIIE